MEPNTPTEEFRPPGKQRATPAGSRDVLPSVAATSHETCPACGSAMAADQRYCVECGQRRGPARVPFLDGIDQPSRDAQAARSSSRRRGRRPLDATLIAGVGTLLLALGIGVLIGRSSNSTTAKSPRVQVVTVGSPGHGPGYQNGHFTGNFFGP